MFQSAVLMEPLMVHTLSIRLINMAMTFSPVLVGADYVAADETLIFNADEDRACFFTSAVDNDLFEDDEMYLLMLTSDEPGLTLDRNIATATIIDDDREHVYYLWC